MKFTSLAVIATVAGLAVLPGVAMADTEIHGRSEFAVESALRAQGLSVSNVEEWGQYVRAYVRADNGATTMQFFDADTLQPVSL